MSGKRHRQWQKPPQETGNVTILYIYIYIYIYCTTGDDATCTPIHISHTPSLKFFWKCSIFILWATRPVPLLTSLFENTVTVKNNTFNKYRFHGHADICKQRFCVSNLQKVSDLCSACPNIHSDETAWLPARWSSKYRLACFLFSFHRFAASILTAAHRTRALVSPQHSYFMLITLWIHLIGHKLIGVATAFLLSSNRIL